MRAGALRRRATLQVRSTAVDTAGGQLTVWTDLYTVWCSLEPSSGRELHAAQVMQLEQPMTVMLRWQQELSDPKVVAAMRLVYNGRLFNIHSCQNTNERNRELTLIATEGLNDG
jgi:SPP1 family predicted phage head-tail adaptor